MEQAWDGLTTARISYRNSLSKANGDFEALNSYFSILICPLIFDKFLMGVWPAFLAWENVTQSREIHKRPKTKNISPNSQPCDDLL